MILIGNKKAILTIFCLFIFKINIHATDQYFFHYLTTKDGLSQNEVTSISQDLYGFMWFGTRGGLNHYDGYNFKVFKPVKNELSIANPSIERIFRDSENHIWIGTKSGGLSVYNISTEAFEIIDSIQKLSTRIISFYEDVEGNYWVGSWRNGLWLINNEMNILANYLPTDRVNSIIQTRSNMLFCGTTHGLKVLSQGEFNNVIGLPDNLEITEIVEDPIDSYLWIVGWDLQLIRYNYLTGDIVRYSLPVFDNNEMPKAVSLMLDREGNVWIGTWGNGLLLFDPKKERFDNISFNPKDIKTDIIDYRVILDIYQDNDDDIWIGTDGGGLVKISKKSKFRSLETENAIWRSRELHITTLEEDNEGTIWLGTKANGLYSWKQGEKIKKISINKLYADHITDSSLIKNISKDQEGRLWVSFRTDLMILEKKGNNSYLTPASQIFNCPEFDQTDKILDILHFGDNLWVATQQIGLFHFKIYDNTITLEKHYISSEKEGQLKDNRITSLKIDPKGRFWIGTYKGVFQFNFADSTFIPLTNLISSGNQLLCDIILSMMIDSKGNLWFGTPCNLNKLYETTNGKFFLKEYTNSQGLIDDYINGILEDNSGMIWVSTNAGISSLHPETGKIRSYTELDGLSNSSFSESAMLKSNSGLLYFGSFSGLTFFKPSEVDIVPETPQIAITSFKALNKEVSIGENSILKENINNTERIILTYKEKEFSFEFAVLDFKAPQLNKYAYFLEDEHSDTIFSGDQRNISFSNLPSGEYRLHLAGADSNGNWNRQGKTLMIRCLPPPWKRWYAIIGYVILIMTVVSLISWIGIKQERLQNEVKLAILKQEQDQQLNEYKLRFFTNISHEFRTPLSLILAPINEILDSDISQIEKGRIIEKLKLIKQNTIRLLGLINQLLEFRKIEVGKAVLKAAKKDIIPFIRGICSRFSTMAESEHIKFNQSFNTDQCEIFFDQDKMAIILNNLLSNAFKYNIENGMVKLLVLEDEKSLILRVWNSGEGINSEELPLIFERFYHAAGSKYFGSSGIGLALVKSFVELHHGRLDVNSRKNEFAEFSVILPKGSDHLKETEISDSILKPEISLHSPNTENVVTRTVNTGTSGSRILVVEDNDELRKYLVELLEGEFVMYEAENGKTGYQIAIEKIPDLILTDIYMPVSDGFELCYRIKKNDKTLHIPIVMLTARDTDADKLYAIRKGADEYISKPFDPVYLKEKLKQMIASRNVTALKYKKTIRLEPTGEDIKDEDAIFLEKVMMLIESNLGNTELNSKLLADRMAMSASTFFRHIKRLTGNSPGYFIRSIRMKKAGQLLSVSNMTISEISEKVGYYDLKNFRNNFKAHFKMLPAEYRSKQDKHSITGNNESELK